MDQVIQEDLVARLASEGGSRWLGSHVWHLGRDGWRLDLAGTVDRNICSQPLQRASLRVAGFFTWWSALPTEQDIEANGLKDQLEVDKESEPQRECR